MKTKFIKTVANNIKEARLKAGLRQADVETVADVAYRHFQNIESGKVDVRLVTLWRLAKAFKTSVAQLVRE